MRAAALAVKEGEVQFLLRCKHCSSHSLYYDVGDLHQLELDYAVNKNRSRMLTCVQCGKPTTVREAHLGRRREITEFIKKGIDINTTNKRKQRRHA